MKVKRSIQIGKVKEKDIKQLFPLVSKWMKNDNYFFEPRRHNVPYMLLDQVLINYLQICIHHGICMGIKVNNEWAGIFLSIDFWYLKENKDEYFHFIFSNPFRLAGGFPALANENRALLEDTKNIPPPYQLGMIFYIDPAYRNKRYGRLLFEEVVNAFPECNWAFFIPYAMSEKIDNLPGWYKMPQKTIFMMYDVE